MAWTNMLLRAKQVTLFSADYSWWLWGKHVHFKEEAIASKVYGNVAPLVNSSIL